VCYHTTHAFPWVYVCVALYIYEWVIISFVTNPHSLFARLFRYRLKDATLVPLDPTLTMIHIPDCDAGWLPTQHVHLRVLRGPGIFEAHPFTITNAPPGALPGNPRGIVLYAKVAGDWTRRVHRMAGEGGLEEGDEYELREALMQGDEGKRGYGAEHPGRRVTVMLDGPYGGLKLDFSAYESALVMAGGSGVTFLLGTIEEILSWRQKGQGPRTITAVWAVRDLCEWLS
jgi:ferric-chelate reductase